MKQRITVSLLAILLICLAAGPTSAYGAAGEKKKVVGMIKERGADTITVKSHDGEATILLSDTTQYKMPRGMGFQKDSMSAAVLIPGLNVKVEGVLDDQDRFVAKTITFSKDDLERAEAIQAGLYGTAQQVATNQQNIATNQQNIATNQENVATNKGNIAANKTQIAENEADIVAANKRFDDLTDFDVKNEMTLNYAVGRAALTQEQKEQLQKFATDALTHQEGYIIEVKGFADSKGTASMNQKLSMDRALNVVAYLLQEGKIPQRRVVAPGAMGETNATANNETQQGRADNRRVELKVLVNRGLASTKD
jgi:OOP family OmpA-OmpF porin